MGPNEPFCNQTWNKEYHKYGFRIFTKRFF